MKRLLPMLLLSAVCATVFASPAATHQYMARKQYLFMQPNASAPAPINSMVVGLGGHVDFDLPRWLVVTIPDAALQTIRLHPAIKYIGRVVSGPFVATPSATTTSSSIHRVATESRPVVNGTQTWSSGPYQYDAAGNIAAIGTDTFAYDASSRITTANVKSTTETYSYDSFGNLNYKNTHDPYHPPDITVDFTGTKTDVATNHLALAGYAYDSEGNEISDPSTTNAFDPVNMQREKDVGTVAEMYVYNAADERIGTFECTTAQQGCAGATVSWSLRNEAGKVLRQYEGTYNGGAVGSDPPWAWIEDYVYRDGLLLGAERVAEEGGRRHFHLDHLGTPRLVTGDATQQLAQHDYYPFGVEIAPPGGTIFQDTQRGYDREEPMRFTSHERDLNVGTSPDNNSNYNDFMHARPRVPEWGRFLSIDKAAPTPWRPQTWNRYTYAHNNPLLYIDPDGRDAIAVTFPDYWIRTESGRVPGLGHAGIITIDKQGHTRYFEYGRYDTARKGLARELPNVPSIMFGQNGLPTPASMDRLLGYVSTQAGAGTPIRGGYFRQADAAAMNAYAEGRIAQNADPDRKPYDLVSYSCNTFLRQMLESGGVQAPSDIGDPRPFSYGEKLANTADVAVYFSFSPAWSVFGALSTLFDGPVYIDGVYVNMAHEK